MAKNNTRLPDLKRDMNSNSCLDFSTVTTKGILLPRVPTASLPAWSATIKGMLVYNSTTNKLNFAAASAWEAVTSA
jgi:hypothetical protein